MVEGVKELRAKLDVAVLAWPIQSHKFRKRQIQIRLAGSVYDTRATVSECRSDTVGADYGGSGKASLIEIIV